MTPCAKYLRWLILRDGPISVAKFMTLALTHPEYGYYTGQPVFGKDGDFVTAPEINQTFGEVLGLWLVAAWESQGRPRPFSLLEMGPGRGTLMWDVLNAARVRPDFIDSLSLHLVECSPQMVDAQRSKLDRWNIHWHRHLTSALELIQGQPLFFLGNEYLDALPVHQYEKTDGGFCERLINVTRPGSRHDFCFTLSPPEISVRFSDDDAPIGTIKEICPDAQKTILMTSAHIQRHGGAGLFVDYGYCHDEWGDTFQAVRHHQYHNPFDDVGMVDLSAHVDFGVLKRIADGHLPCGGVSIQNQGDFLVDNGLMVRADRLVLTMDSESRNLFLTGIHRLIDGSEMGKLFKVMTLMGGQKPT